MYIDDTKPVDVPVEQVPSRGPGLQGLRQVTFRVKALADPHLSAAGQPIGYALQDPTRQS